MVREKLVTKQTDSFFTVAWGFAVMIIIIALIIGIAQIIASWKLYKKCGRKGWKSIIPFYASWIKIVEIAKLNWWWFLIALLPPILLFNEKNMTVIISLVTLFVTFQCNYNIVKKFHKGTGFAILMTLLPTILYLILAFSKDYVYDDSVQVSKNGIIKDNDINNTNNNINISNKCCSACGTQINNDVKYCPTCGNEIK